MPTDIYARIRQAAFELVSEGTWPTVAEVRQRLGTGSNTTINNTLKAWRQEFLSRIAVSSRRPDWSTSLTEAFEQIWQKACDEAERQLDGVREETQAQAKELEVALVQAKLELEARAGEVSALAQTLELKEQRLSELNTRLEQEGEHRQNLEGQLGSAQTAQDGLHKQLLEAQAQFDTRLAEAEAKTEVRVQEERAQAEKRESLAYERLEGLRVRLYEQVEDERAAMKLSQKRLEDELAAERKAKNQQEIQWRERLSEMERASGRLAATVEVQNERLTQLAKEVEQEREVGREAQLKLLAASELIGNLRASQHSLLERLLPRLAAGLHGHAASLAQQDEATRYAWLKNQIAEVLPEAVNPI